MSEEVVETSHNSIVVALSNSNSDTKSRREMLGMISGGISHDMNNLLSPILLGVQTLQRNEPDEKTQRILNMIEQSARRAAELNRHVLDYTRNEIVSETIVLSDIIHAVQDYVSSVERGAIRYHFQNRIPSTEEIFTLHTNAEDILFVLKHLLQNSRESILSEGMIDVELSVLDVDGEFTQKVRAARKGTYLSITVIDNGIGIPSDIQQKMFEPFFTSKKEKGNSGIGLFLVQTFVKHHSGFTYVQSEDGKGTRVIVSLPISK